MEDKNSLLEEKVVSLEEKLNKTTENQKQSFKTYANVVNTNNKTNTPKLIIQPKIAQGPAKTKADVFSKIKPAELQVGINKVTGINNGSLIIKCSNEKDLNILQEKVVEHLGNTYDIRKQSLVKPRLKIVGIEKRYSEEELTSVIRMQNSLNDDLTVVHIQHIVGKKTYTAFLETTPRVFAHFMSEGNILIEWQRCKCYEDLNLNKCIKCKGYKHSSKKCKEKNPICGNCAETHEGDCQGKVKKCINCVRSNTKYKTKYETSHSVYELEVCQTYQLQKLLQKSKIDYSF